MSFCLWYIPYNQNSLPYRLSCPVNKDFSRCLCSTRDGDGIDWRTSVKRPLQYHLFVSGLKSTSTPLSRISNSSRSWILNVSIYDLSSAEIFLFQKSRTLPSLQRNSGINPRLDKYTLSLDRLRYLSWWLFFLQSLKGFEFLPTTTVDYQWTLVKLRKLQTKFRENSRPNLIGNHLDKIRMMTPLWEDFSDVPRK